MKRIVSNAEIECLGHELLINCFGSSYHDKKEIDIDVFAHFLNLRVVYASICEDDINKIGFLADGETPLKVRMNGLMEEIIYPKKTIVLDRFLWHAEEKTKRRFVLAHEIGHYVLDRYLGVQHAGSYHTRLISGHMTSEEIKECCTLTEMQANRMAAVLLMPEDLVLEELRREVGHDYITIYNDTLLAAEERKGINIILNHLSVSRDAFFIRLRELGLIRFGDGQDYVSMVFRGDDNG